MGTKKITYKCEDGWELSGDKCYHDTRTSGHFECNANETLVRTECFGLSSTYAKPVTEQVVTTCKKEIVGDNYGSTAEYDGVVSNEGAIYCYYKEVNNTKDTCATSGNYWNPNNNKCYQSKKSNNYTSTCKDNNHYVYLTKGSEYLKNGAVPGCYPRRNATPVCPADYPEYTIRGTGAVMCTKTEEKPAIKIES